ncbi:MAG TPA: glycoside hydrolase family 15 protein [Actinomycetota bacterium]|jgi:GH15 family glucan-1,4-alpha-glucosidase
MNHTDGLTGEPLPPIADYALIGDGRTAALCSSRGSIDWLCLPRFDDEPVFGRLVGGNEAGSFVLTVDDVRETRRRYRENSPVLETTWTADGAEATLTEGLVSHVDRLVPQMLLVRRVEARGGPVKIRMRFDPRTGLSGERLRAGRRSHALMCFRGKLALALTTDPDVQVEPGRDVDVWVEPGKPFTAVLGMADRQPMVFVDPERAFEMLDQTDRWWREWAKGIRYRGPLSPLVIRSLLTLRLLTYSPSGAPVAAPTTSLPEEVGGGRNWDYRFSWPRDASIGARSFLETGLVEESHSFLHWLLVASHLTRPKLQVLYTLDGNPGISERELGDAPGYRGSRPVRIGNGAASQHQLDVYGWVIDAAWYYEDSGNSLHGATWRVLRSFADLVADRWPEPDAGIWEVRGSPTQYVHSKLMGWAALDRALRLATSRRAKRSRVERWRRERDALATDIRARGFNSVKNAYTRSYGSKEMDAALLILPELEFEPPNSPRVIGTVDAIRRELSAGGPLLYRYPPGRDDLSGGEGAFLPCSFWLVEALARTGRAEEARGLFEELGGRANDVGLFGEEMNPTSGEHLGNFPQALTHAALVQAALSLQRASAA